MHLPKHFEVTDGDRINQFIAAHAFATLTTSINGELEANYIPMQLVVNKDRTPSKLQGHFARTNPLVKHLTRSTNCLCAFMGADSYITPNWYDTKKQTGMVVPTWNYEVAHVRGTIQIIDDENWLLDFLNRLTDKHEANQLIPWKVDDAPGNYINEKLKGIIGFEIDIESVSMKSKLNQNHPIGNQSGIVEGIGSKATDKQQAIAEGIKRNLEALF